MILDSVPDYPKIAPKCPKPPQTVPENKAIDFLLVVRDAYPLLITL